MACGPYPTGVSEASVKIIMSSKYEKSLIALDEAGKSEGVPADFASAG